MFLHFLKIYVIKSGSAAILKQALKVGVSVINHANPKNLPIALRLRQEPRVDAQKVHSLSWAICVLSNPKGMDIIQCKRLVVRETVH